MTDISQFVHKFRANGDTGTNANNKVGKRNRQPLSCLPCRTKKLKCDRAHPCEMCIKRNDEGSCTYSRPPTSGKADVAGRAKAHDRLRQLEQLVMQMAESNASPQNGSTTQVTPPTTISTASTEDEAPRDGALQHGSSTSNYVGSTHWSAILENIQEIKSAITEDPGESPEAEDLDDRKNINREILFGSTRTMSLQQILSQYLPPRIQIDRLLSVYFNAKYFVIPYIHTYQFQRQYEKFWIDPLRTSPHWISILFSICCIASQLSTSEMAGSSNGEDGPRLPFLTAAAHCLVLGGYTRPKPYVVEALAMYSQCIYMSSLDPLGQVGITFAILIRLAYRMAYHRDPDNFSHYSVFEGEMRRRVWTMCRQFDLMTSFQLGLPNNIPPDSWDTKPPRNLLDADFDEDSTQLPPSRPENEPTQILYFIVKSRLMTNFGRICNHALSFRNSSQEEILDLDHNIRGTFTTVPSVLRVRPMSKSFADPPYLLMVRLNCEFLYQKSLLVLHRKYMTQGFDYSTKACIAAAMAITSCFADIHKEFQVGGQLYNDRWMLSSFTMNDFLLATMVLCLSISQWRKRFPSRHLEDDPEIMAQLDMIRTALAICLEQATTSVESRKVAEALKVMFAQIDPSRAPETQLPQPGSCMPSIPTFEGTGSTPLSIKEAPMPQTGSDPYANADLGPFENFFEGMENIDWAFLDQYLVNPERYEEDLSMGQQAWVSTPYRFLGQENKGTPGSSLRDASGNLAIDSQFTTNGGPENIDMAAGGLDANLRPGY